MKYSSASNLSAKNKKLNVSEASFEANTRASRSKSAEKLGQARGPSVIPEKSLLTCVWLGQRYVAFAAPESAAFYAQTDKFLQRAHASAVLAALNYGGYRVMHRGLLDGRLARAEEDLPGYIICAGDGTSSPDMQELHILGLLYRSRLAEKLGDVGYELEFSDRESWLFSLKGPPGD